LNGNLDGPAIGDAIVKEKRDWIGRERDGNFKVRSAAGLSGVIFWQSYILEDVALLLLDFLDQPSVCLYL